MESIISTIADICGILGFLISLFAVGQVYSIKNKINNSNKVKVSDSEIGGDFVGRDKNHV